MKRYETELRKRQIKAGIGGNCGRAPIGTDLQNRKIVLSVNTISPVLAMDLTEMYGNNKTAYHLVVRLALG